MNPTIRLLLASLAVVALAASAGADDRPKVGLALSGGGARGAAHVGVLEVLEELRVPVDYVAGTSMGAVVGGFYAAGYSPAEIEEILASQDWPDVLADRTSYRDLVFRRKEDERRYLMDVDVGLKKGGFELPGGLLNGQKLNFLLQRYLHHVADVTDFSRLPTPFVAVATDIATGEEVRLAGGSLPTALRASMAIPGVFSPVELDSRLLVDGGIANNVPVDVVRAMGADVVIAVDVSDPLLEKKEIRSLVGVTNQTLNFLTRKNMAPQLADADLVLTPAIEGTGAMGFDASSAIVDMGGAEARFHAAELSAWSVDEPAFESLAARRRRPRAEAVEIGFIRVTGQQRVDERVIRQRLRVEAGDRVDWPLLGKDLERVYGLGDFETAGYRLVRDADGTPGLELEVREKPWGPNYLRFGLELASDLEGETSFALRANLTKTRLNGRGGEWRTDLRIGEDQSIVSELYQPLDFGGRLFVAPRLLADTERQSIFADDRRMAELKVDGAEVGLDLGVRLGRDGELRAGVLFGRDEAEVETGIADLPTFDVDRGGFRLKLEIDGTDNPAIPRSGFLLQAELFLSRSSLGADLSYEKLGGRATQFLDRGRHTWLAGIEGGTGLGSDLPFFDQFRVGGLFSLGGLADGQLRGSVYTVSRVGYYYELVELLPGLGSGVYAGAMFEVGDVWASNDQVTFDDLETSATVFLATETFIGPLFVGWGVAGKDRDRFYLGLGRVF